MNAKFKEGTAIGYCLVSTGGLKVIFLAEVMWASHVAEGLWPLILKST